MICPHCKKKIVDNAVMCPYCEKFVDQRYMSNSNQNTARSTSSYSARPVAVKSKPAKKKKSALLLASAILGALYAVYSIFYWAGANSGNASVASAIGAGIATYLVMPHLLCAILAAIFNVLVGR